MHNKSAYNAMLKLAVLGYALFAFAAGFDFSLNRTEAATLSKPANNLGLVGYWSFEDATGTVATDFSGNGRNGTLTSMDAATDWVAGKRGKALDFDGSNDYLGSFGDVIDMRQNDMTISAWVKIPVGSTGYSCIASKSYAGPGNGRWSACISPTGLTYFLMEYGGTAKDEIIGTVSVEDGRWHHVVLVYDRDSVVRSYVDGVSDGTSSSVAASDGNDMDNSYPFIVGAYGDGNGGAYGNVMNGSMDELRIYNRALSATEIGSLYGSGAGKFAQGPSKNGLVGYWSFDEGTSTVATDFSGRGNTGTINGGATWVSGRQGKALQFDGTDDWVSFANVPTTATDNWTMMAWVNPAALPQGPTVFVSNGYDNAVNAGDGYSFGIGNGFGSSGSSVQGASNGVAWASPSPGYAFPSANTWYHVTVMRRSGTRVYYVNGVSIGTAGSVPTAPTKFSIGAADNGSGSPTYRFQGKIDEVRVYDRALSDAEVVAAARSGTQYLNVSQNRTRSSLDTGLIGLWSFNGQDVNGTTAFDRSGNGNNGTISGAMPALGKVGQALRLDGTDDYVEIPDSPSWDFSGAFTWSAWIKTTSTPGQWDGIISRDGTSPYPVYLRFANSSLIEFAIDNSGGLAYALSPATNRWYHVVALWDGSSTKRIYVDGVEVAQNAQTAAPTATSDPLYIGLDYLPGNSRNFPGYIDEVRVYNRALSAAEVKQLYNLGK